MFRLIAASVFFTVCLACIQAHADASGPNAADHAPIGVMGDHMHEKGEFMLSYRFMHMDMQGNRAGTDSIDADTIVTTVPNRFFGRPMQPPTLRIVPTSMSMDMHMFGAMYAPADGLTLMVMGMYMEKDMEHTTYMGGMGTNVRGSFRVKTDGIGDTRVSGLVRLHDGGVHRLHLNAGVSFPTGSTSKTHEILTPMGARPTVRVPYAMQPGSGTYDLMPGITYNGHSGKVYWGGQYMGTFRLGENHGYSLGDKHTLSAWLNYQWRPFISTSLRLQYEMLRSIEGMDPMIAGPVQTADPGNYGSDELGLNFGVNLMGQAGALAGQRLAAELYLPLRRDLNGPQMETDWTITLGWQYAF
ncbi:MAG: transporter [Gammaproteobacteria bacterium]|nr:transporter [Gammaproteobacteria bacterium]